MRGHGIFVSTVTRTLKPFVKTDREKSGERETIITALMKCQSRCPARVPPIVSKTVRDSGRDICNRTRRNGQQRLWADAPVHFALSRTLTTHSRRSRLTVKSVDTGSFVNRVSLRPFRNYKTQPRLPFFVKRKKNTVSVSVRFPIKTRLSRTIIDGEDISITNARSWKI